MNIFVLSPSPQESARSHCDQHLHKMILESAQMLSTVMHLLPSGDPVLRRVIYKPTHQNHPCTKWMLQSLHNTEWVINLCEELQNIKYDLGQERHSSMEIIAACKEWLIPTKFNEPENFIFAGPAFIKLDNLRYPTISSKYQEYYRYKARTWLDSGRRMSYKGRPVPDFMKDSI